MYYISLLSFVNFMDHDSGKGQQWFIIKQKRKILSKENLVLINKILEFQKIVKARKYNEIFLLACLGHTLQLVPESQQSAIRGGYVNIFTKYIFRHMDASIIKFVTKLDPSNISVYLFNYQKSGQHCLFEKQYLILT